MRGCGTLTQRSAGNARREGDATVDDLPAPADTLTDNGTVIKASKRGERGCMEPVYQGEPILAVAAVDELTAAEAIEKIKIEFEPLPFVVDPLVTLRPGGPNPRTDGNVWMPGSSAARRLRRSRRSRNSKWTDEDFEEYKTAVCRWASPPMSGRTATWMAVSRMQRWFSMKHSSRPNTSHQIWKPAARWPIGRTAKCSFTPARKARIADDAGDRAMDEHGSRTTSFSSANIPAADSEARSPAASP